MVVNIRAVSFIKSTLADFIMKLIFVPQIVLNNFSNRDLLPIKKSQSNQTYLVEDRFLPFPGLERKSVFIFRCLGIGEV